jgi:2'-5' RNA ligase
LTDEERAPESEHKRSARVRAFYALPLSDEAKSALVSARDALRRRAERSRITARFLSDDSLHLTVCFLGYVDRERIPDFVHVLEASSRVSPIDTHLLTLGAFSSPRRARVIVAELDDPGVRLAALARAVTLGAEKLGVPPEARAFRPHVTLARIKRPADVRDWLEHSTLDPVAASFGELVLYESVLHPTGSRYFPLARAAFASPGA